MEVTHQTCDSLPGEKVTLHPIVIGFLGELIVPDIFVDRLFTEILQTYGCCHSIAHRYSTVQQYWKIRRGAERQDRVGKVQACRQQQIADRLMSLCSKTVAAAETVHEVMRRK